MNLNYRHLYYFWVVAREGGFSKAADRLDMAVQTVSAQVRELESNLGQQLLKPSGRGVVLSEAGQTAFRRAEEIFQLGSTLIEELAKVGAQAVLRFSLGLPDGVSKLAVHRLLEPVLQLPHLRLLCHEGEFDPLIGELAMHQLDAVIASQPAPANPNLRLFSQKIASSQIHWYGPESLLGQLKPEQRAFPLCLQHLPVLLPTTHTPLRHALDRWFETEHLHVHITGEFEDSALMSLFAMQGMGVFPVSALGAEDLKALPGLHCLGTTQLGEDLYLINTRRARQHPAVLLILHPSESTTSHQDRPTQD
ncbi:MAG: LysR family transcriptional regulator [Betaproteobacteria bacterium]|nr:LysR family transcriptional regulator [Betaproteobacteria bacterium]